MLNINASEDQTLSRTRSRVQRLRQAIAKEKNSQEPNSSRIESLEQEADSRINQLKSLIGEFECLR